jgi:hypothetical protein
MGRSKSFTFDGGAATYLGTGILAFLVTVLTLGICAPFGVVLRQRWRAKHTYVEGRRLIFVGGGFQLFGLWLLWWLLTIVTLGIYFFWVGPRLQKWIVENTDFDPNFSAAAGVSTPVPRPEPTSAPAAPARQPATERVSLVHPRGTCQECGEPIPRPRPAACPRCREPYGE